MSLHTMNSTLYQEKIAQILKISKRAFAETIAGLERVTGKHGVIERLFFENERLVSEKLATLGVSHEAPAYEVYDALVSKVEADDAHLLKRVGHTSLRGYAASQAVVKFVTKAYSGTRRGFFLKRKKAQAFLRAEPPQKILAALGYTTVDALLKKENLYEVYSALRFLEDEVWQNTIFFKQYESLTPDDFEERAIEVRALGEKWAGIAEKFMAKKYHNVSHLKELGVIFVIPIFLGISGETLRMVSLLLHYFHEVAYYSDTFRQFAETPKTFAHNLISVLRGDVLEKPLSRQLPEAARPRFLVVQRYLAKLDHNDWRLAEPRVNPEALHWQKAEEDIMKITDHTRFGLAPNRVAKGVAGSGAGFWNGTGWVGDFFKTDVGEDSLMSFNLGDVVMTLVKQKLVRYLYHQQEALWNKIFIEYFSAEKLETLSKQNIVKGWFEV